MIMEQGAQPFYQILEFVRSFFLFIYKSFFGSETQNPYSESYIWMANQFGHFFIGFGGLFLLTWIASYWLRRPAPSYSYGCNMVDPQGRPTVRAATVWWLAALWLAIWMAKEWLFDYTRGSYIAWIYVDPFKDDLIWDTATDSFFYIAGTAVALAHFGALRLAPIPVLASVLVIAAGLAAYWLPAREKIETTGTPYFLRLSGLYPGIDIAELDKTQILQNLQANDPAARMGLESAMRPTEYPFQYLMEPQTDKKQIMTVGNIIFISRFFIAMANERVIRQQVEAPCNTRYITFRDLMNAEIVNKAQSGEPDWEIESPSGQYAGFNGPGCVLEKTELLIVDQVPATENAAALIKALMSIPPVLPADAAATDPSAGGAASSVASSADAGPGLSPEAALQIFIRSVRNKTVIWILDNDAVVDGWTAALRGAFPPDNVSFLDLR
ncbi:MAG: hypothetical protein HC850_00490 [Rhodomicrobium sp.]|nr:hypothetical protein [Rhodomicrobium sp.]